jgi:hypothetical protein
MLAAARLHSQCITQGQRVYATLPIYMHTEVLSSCTPCAHSPRSGRRAHLLASPQRRWSSPPGWPQRWQTPEQTTAAQRQQHLSSHCSEVAWTHIRFKYTLIITSRLAPNIADT